MIQRYGIAADERPLEEPSPDLYRAFADFGYGECLDAFLGFGVFKIARRAGYLPEPMFAIFETLLHEENRHIVFFVNWMAWEQARRGRGASWLRAAVAARYYLAGNRPPSRHRAPWAGGERRQGFLGDAGERLYRWFFATRVSSRNAAPSMRGG